MRYFYDCEFLENGSTIDLISIGMICEDGREFYAVNGDFNFNRLERDDWMMENVVPSLPLRGQPVKHGERNWSFAIDDTDPLVKTSNTIRTEIYRFITESDRKDVELWADYGAYDHVVLCQLFGKMIDLPSKIPMYTNDLQQLIKSTGIMPTAQNINMHNALDDARELKRQFEEIQLTVSAI